MFECERKLAWLPRSSFPPHHARPHAPQPAHGRSLNEAEKQRQCAPCITVCPESRSVIAGSADRGGAKPFTFDSVFGPDAGQESVYDAAVQQLVAQFLAGYVPTTQPTPKE